MISETMLNNNPHKYACPSHPCVVYAIRISMSVQRQPECAAFCTGTPLTLRKPVQHHRHQRHRSLSELQRTRFTVAATMAPPQQALKTRQLGSSDLLVTEVCLGTMTFGVQNSEAEAHAQLDYAIKERGVNFLDTAGPFPAHTRPPLTTN